jgi:hypothetical protein
MGNIEEVDVGERKGISKDVERANHAVAGVRDDQTVYKLEPALAQDVIPGAHYGADNRLHVGVGFTDWFFGAPDNAYGKVARGVNYFHRYQGTEITEDAGTSTADFTGPPGVVLKAVVSLCWYLSPYPCLRPVTRGVPPSS